jgi:hypothetical protein
MPVRCFSDNCPSAGSEPVHEAAKGCRLIASVRGGKRHIERPPRLREQDISCSLLACVSQLESSGKLESLLGPVADSERVMGNQGKCELGRGSGIAFGIPLFCEILSRSSGRCVGRIFD